MGGNLRVETLRWAEERCFASLGSLRWMVPTIDAHPKAPPLLGPCVICEPHLDFFPPSKPLGVSGALPSFRSAAYFEVLGLQQTLNPGEIEKANTCWALSARGRWKWPLGEPTQIETVGINID